MNRTTALATLAVVLGPGPTFGQFDVDCSDCTLGIWEDTALTNGCGRIAPGTPGAWILLDS